MSEKNSFEHKYLLAACLEPVALGDEFGIFPPHITVLPPFVMADDLKTDFNRMISDGAEDHLPILGLAGHPIMMGKNHDTKVMPINFVDPGVFANAIISANRLGLHYDDRFSIDYKILDEGIIYDGEEINVACTRINHPHITNFEGLSPLDEINIFEMQLFCYGALKRVVSVYRRNGYDTQI